MLTSRNVINVRCEILGKVKLTTEELGLFADPGQVVALAEFGMIE